MLDGTTCLMGLTPILALRWTSVPHDIGISLKLPPSNPCRPQTLKTDCAKGHGTYMYIHIYIYVDIYVYTLCICIRRTPGVDAVTAPHGSF